VGLVCKEPFNEDILSLISKGASLSSESVSIFNKKLRLKAASRALLV